MNNQAKDELTVQTQTCFFKPSQRLQPYIDCYWLSNNQQATQHTILPDGCVDIVFALSGEQLKGFVYGTTTQSLYLPIQAHTQYLGIRFKAGQSRHFLLSPALELTNTSQTLQYLLRFSIDPIIDQFAGPIRKLIIDQGKFYNQTCLNKASALRLYLDTLFEAFLSHYPPATHPIDLAIQHIQHARGNQLIHALKLHPHLSPRQFERLFKLHTGVSAKQYAAICRFHHAISLMMQGNSLVNTAIDAGFSDQSHFSHDIKRLTGLPPQQFFRQHVVFLQDQQYPVR